MNSVTCSNRTIFFLSVLLASFLSPYVFAQDYDNNWETGFHVNGLDGPAYAIVDYDGCQIIGGSFTHAGSLAANGIVGWDPVSERFFPLGSGLSGYVRGMTVSEGNLIVAGWLSRAGEVPVSNVACWDGVSWSALGEGMPYVVNTIATFNGEIYLGKYRWTGSVWEDFAQPDGFISDLMVWDGKLVLSGNFSEIRGIQVASICIWDGTTIAPLGSGFETKVMKLQSFGNHLVAGLYIEPSGVVSYDLIQLWDGTSWTSLNFMIDIYNEVYSLILGEFQGNLLVSAGVTNGFTGEILTKQYDGSQWIPLLEILEPRMIYSFHTAAEELFVGGLFGGAETVVSANLLRFNGTTVQPFVQDGMGLTSGAGSLCNFAGDLVVGGYFEFAGALFSPAAAAWTETGWTNMSELVFQGNPVAYGPNTQFLHLVADDEHLYSNYSFSSGCLESRLFCYWDSPSSQWLELYLGKGEMAFLDDQIYSLSFGNESGLWVYQEEQWQPVPGEFNSFIKCISSWNGKIVVGGNFSQVDGVEVNRIAVWDGAQWGPLGEGLPGITETFGIFNGQLVAGYSADWNYYTAIWDGAQWQEMAGEFEDDIICFQQFGDHLYAGGMFEDIDGLPAKHLAWWNGQSWTSYGAGVNGYIRDMEVHDGKLYLVGDFSSTGNITSRGLACLPEPLGALTALGQEAIIQSDLIINPNSPNPFNPMTTFTFYLPRECQLSLDVYDVRGSLIKHISGGNFPAGENSATWNGKDTLGAAVPSGVYFVRIVSDVGIQTRKITLAR